VLGPIHQSKSSNPTAGLNVCGQKARGEFGAAGEMPKRGDTDAIRPNSNDPNTIGSNAIGPNAIGPNAIRIVPFYRQTGVSMHPSTGLSTCQ
jgi:hypothetical protein